MKRILIILVFFLLSLDMPSAYLRELYILSTPSYSEFDRLLYAIGWVESRNYDLALNMKEQACGRLQIRACRIEHYNRMTGKNYSHADCFDYEVSKEVFLYFAQGKSYEKASRDWNGSGKKTVEYWKRVKKML